MSMILAGDIGATNTRLAVFSQDLGLRKCVDEEIFTSNNFTSLEEILSEFVRKFSDIEINAAAFVAAGPKVDESIHVTNLNWSIIKTNDISKFLGNIPVALHNDLLGISNIIPELLTEHLEVLNQAPSYENAPIGVLAPGSGLGEGYLVWNGNEYIPYPSEGGHTDFAPRNELQQELLNFLSNKYGHVSYEHACSGLGVPDLYTFLKEKDLYKEPTWITEKINDDDNPVPIIFSAAQNNESDLCKAVVELFVDIMGAEAGNLALKIMSTGGIYLSGGIPPRILNFLRSHFLSSFIDKGSFKNILKKIPVYVVVHPQPALYGAAKFAFDLLK